MAQQLQQRVDIELLHQRLKELDGQLEHIDVKLEQTILAKNMLTSLQKTPSGNELLIPIGGGIFVTVHHEHIREVRQAVGAGVLVELSADEALERIASQQTQLLASQQQLAQAYDITLQKAMQLQSQLEE